MTTPPHKLNQCNNRSLSLCSTCSNLNNNNNNNNNDLSRLSHSHSSNNSNYNGSYHSSSLCRRQLAP